MKRFTLVALLCAAIALSVPNAAFAAKTISTSGAIPSSLNLAKPSGLVGATDAPPLLGGEAIAHGSGDSDGTNNISFLNFDTGDMCCVFGSGFGHAGLFDGARYHGLMSNYCMISANVSPLDGVQLEQPAKYRRYDRAYGLWVPSVSQARRDRARDYANENMGEPYNLNSSKTDTSRWYCSKLIWAAYNYRVGKNLDSNGGYWVSPADLVNDSETALFAKGL